MCADAPSDDERPAEVVDTRLARVAADGNGLARPCSLVAEVRLGKNVKRLGAWVSQHRKAQKVVKKTVKGAKEVFFRKQGGYLWLSLRWQIGAAEQYPGAPYLQNFTHCVNFPAPGTWDVEGEALDSKGLPKAGPSQVGNVLSTM